MVVSLDQFVYHTGHATQGFGYSLVGRERSRTGSGFQCRRGGCPMREDVVEDLIAAMLTIYL